MKAFEIINERVQQRTQIMYHGTSTNLIPSIKSNGLLATPPKKTYDKDTYGASTASMGGVYVASEKGFALEVAREAVGTHGGEKALVTIQYVKGSGDLDEDEIVASISDAAQQIMRKLSANAPNKRPDIIPSGMKFKDETPDRYSGMSYPDQGWAADWMVSNIDKSATQIATRTIEILQKKSKPSKQAISIVKQMATKLLQSASKVEDAYGRSRAIGFDAYDTFRENMEDLLSVLMQQVNPDTANKSAESRRINRDVKFKGKTRILQIESPVGNIVYKDANFN